MTYWYCRECRTIYSEAQMLPGWDGWWCSNCIWSEVEAVAAPGAAGAARTSRRKPARRSLSPRTPGLRRLVTRSLEPRRHDGTKRVRPR